MTGKVDMAYWDTCIFLAYFKNEKRMDPCDLQGIEEQVALLDNGKLHLVTSVITLIEILECTMPPGTRDQFTLLFQRPNYHLIDITRDICDIAHRIRNYYKEKSIGNLPTIKTPDAIHLATAISYGCSRMYTFDGIDGHGNGLALIPLSPLIANQYNLVIEKPKPTQPQLGI